MAGIGLMMVGLYAWWNRPVIRTVLNQPKPNNPGALPPIDPYNPSKNDMIRPPSWTYDPLRQLGRTERFRAKPTAFPYPQERYLSEESLSSDAALYKTQQFREAYQQQQAAYNPVHRFLDPVYWNTGVKPPSRIRSSGHPAYLHVPPYTISSVSTKAY